MDFVGDSCQQNFENPALFQTNRGLRTNCNEINFKTISPTGQFLKQSKSVKNSVAFLGVKSLGFCWRFLATAFYQSTAKLTSKNKKENFREFKI